MVIIVAGRVGEGKSRKLINDACDATYDFDKILFICEQEELEYLKGCIRYRLYEEDLDTRKLYFVTNIPRDLSDYDALFIDKWVEDRTIKNILSKNEQIKYLEYSKSLNMMR